MRVSWLTDIHLNFLDETAMTAFARSVGQSKADFVLLTGDIAEAPTLERALRLLCDYSSARVLYVLGNHDFYKSTVNEVRAHCRSLRAGTYLHGSAPVGLTAKTCVVGADGWADGGYGDPRGSDLIFTDWYLIKNFRDVDAITNVDERLRLAQAFAAESANVLRRSLLAAVQHHNHVIVLTHIPPFARAAGDNGSAMAQIWLPWLACRATGDVLCEVADAHPDVRFEVLCGHTHVARVSHERPNITTHTGAATYRSPQIQRVWDVG